MSTFTPEQLAERTRYIGASEVAAALGLDKWQTEWELWARKTGTIPPAEMTAPMQLGLWLEPHLLEAVEVEVGEAVAPGGEYRIPDSPIVAHPDGLLFKSERVVEAKSSAVFNRWADLSEWGEPGTDEVPLGVIYQTQTQLAATGMRAAVVPAFLGERGLVFYDVERDEVVIAEIVDRMRAWWDRHIVQGIEPDPTKAPIEELSRRPRESGKRIRVPDEVFSRAYNRRSDRLEAEKLEEEAKQALLAAMGDAEMAENSRGETMELREIRQKRFNQKRFAKEQPKLAAEYTEQTSHRRAFWKREDK